MSSSRVFDAVARRELDRMTFSVQYAGLAFLYYDYLLTLADEIQYIWRSRWRLSTLFYILCRYALVANLIYYLSIAKDPKILDCNTGYIISGTLSLLGHGGVIAVWGLRTYTICSKNKYVAGVLGLSGGLTIVLLAIRAPFNRCTGPLPLRGIRGVISASMIFFDVTAFLLATYRTWRSIREGRKSPIKIKGSANNIIFAQGLLYMAPVFVLSVASLVMNFEIKFYFTRLLNAFKLPLSGLLTARFLLELRKWEAKQNRCNEGRCSLVLQFNTNDQAEDVINGRLPIRPANVSRSDVSILDELGGDIGPRDSADDLVADAHNHDVEAAYEDPVELDDLTSPPTASQNKGKRREEAIDGLLDVQEAPIQSVPRKVCIDLEAGLVPGIGPSQERRVSTSAQS